MGQNTAAASYVTVNTTAAHLESQARYFYFTSYDGEKGRVKNSSTCTACSALVDVFKTPRVIYELHASFKVPLLKVDSCCFMQA